MVVAVLFIILGVMIVFDSVRLGFKWGMSGPEAGFFPSLLGTGLVVCSLIVLYHAVVKFLEEGEVKSLMPSGAWKPILWVLIPSTLMVVITELVGLHIAAALYLAFYMRAVGRIGWATTLAITVLVPLSLYVAFDKLFLVPLPQGLWGAKLIPI